MKPSEILKIKRDEVVRAVSFYPVSSPRVFGSVLHGTDSEESDIDLLIEALPNSKFSLFSLGILVGELEQILGVKVDLLTPGFLPKRFREKVLKEAHPL